jgi:hypothetical protein
MKVYYPRNLFCGELSVFFHGASVAHLLAVGRRLTTVPAGWPLTANQATNQKAKGGVRHWRETSSLARFDDFCVRNALLEMVNGALD